jgi:hypothetical protein
LWIQIREKIADQNRNCQFTGDQQYIQHYYKRCFLKNVCQSTEFERLSKYRIWTFVQVQNLNVCSSTEFERFYKYTIWTFVQVQNVNVCQSTEFEHLSKYRICWQKLILDHVKYPVKVPKQCDISSTKSISFYSPPAVVWQLHSKKTSHLADFPRSRTS